MKPITILVVEDEEWDAEQFQRVLRQAHVVNDVVVMQSTEEMFRYLATSPLPGLIFLDVSLPGRSGIQALIEMRDTPRYAELPVIICSGSRSSTVIKLADELLAAGYIVKPINASAFFSALSEVKGISVVLVRDESSSPKA